MGQSIETLESEPLFSLDLKLEGRHVIGATPSGQRRITPILGGRFEGPRLRGEVLPGGADWVVVRADGAMLIDVRITLKTDDDVLIYMAYQGIAAASAETMARVNNAEVLAYRDYYVRSTPRFEVAAGRYGWLNSIISVGNGMRTEDGATYRIFQIL